MDAETWDGFLLGGLASCYLCALHRFHDPRLLKSCQALKLVEPITVKEDSSSHHEASEGEDNLTIGYQSGKRADDPSETRCSPPPMYAWTLVNPMRGPTLGRRGGISFISLRSANKKYVASHSRDSGAVLTAFARLPDECYVICAVFDRLTLDRLTLAEPPQGPPGPSSSLLNTKIVRGYAPAKKRAKNSDGGRNKENVADSDHSEGDVKQTEEQFKKKDTDVCYEIKKSDVMGRYLIAKRDIKAGEIVIEEPALAVGPCAGCGLICLGCYRELDECSIHKCPSCKWPLCSDMCPGRGKWVGHSREECEVFKNIAPNYGDLDDLKDSYQAIMPLRCLLLKSCCPEKWSALSAMEAHNGLRRARGDIWPTNEKHVVDRIVKAWRLAHDPDEIHTVCGILEVNAFEVGGSGASARALYDRAYLLAHECTPSTTHTDAEKRDGRPIIIRAAVPHKAGDLITLCYAYTLQGTLKRREHIQHSKFFSCICKRCSDPTELGTYASAFRCPKCAGRMLSTAPLDAAAAWKCGDNGCPYTMPAAAVQLLLKRLTDEFEQIDANDVRGFEAFLHKYRNVLHTTHYLCLSAKHSLSQLYGKVAEYMIHEMPDEELNRKIAICRDLMGVFDIIEPGYSRLRGVTLYELHAPLMILTTRDFEKKAITKENLRNRLKEIVNCLTESALILGFEPSQSSEGLMASAAREALTKIKTWEKIIGKIS
ncbi:SET domain-containing protein SmydA-8, isoform A [Eumeta japonica]|uniref:SET domain-containing protein SmydA-8, isoform A n=1 Tax=Eumeta variegata TaxID=151549 RepID=A0A4C1UMW1_EUMVA|nr:SET domain-containing protein SmydA-8, isoform A [Eumeta japonica]